MAFMTEGAKYLMFADSTWDYSKYRGTLVAEGRRMAPLGDATDPDLRPFAAHNGKLIIYHGWADPALNPLATVAHYDTVLARDPHARDYVRLFMLPGVLHCGGGNGPSNVDWMSAITAWTENGRAPEEVIATKHDRTVKTIRSRPSVPTRSARFIKDPVVLTTPTASLAAIPDRLTSRPARLLNDSFV